jgi:NDP-sugar pyrophosphorylase family protein
LLGDLFWVTYGDSYLDIDYAAILDDFLRQDQLGLMTVLRNEGRWDTSNVVFRSGRLLCYDKKNRTPEMAYIDYGLALLRREALDGVPEGAFCDLADVYSGLVKRGQMVGHEVSRRFYEIGSPAGLEETRRHLQPHKPRAA